MGHSKTFLRSLAVVFLIFSFLSGCSALKKQRQQEQVLLKGKTFMVENRSEDDIYRSLVEWSEGETSSYRRVNEGVEGRGLDAEKTLTIRSHFFTLKGDNNPGHVDGEDLQFTGFVIYEVTFTVSSDQVTAVPHLMHYCKGKHRKPDVLGSLTRYGCREIDNSFNEFTFEILDYFKGFYDRVEKIINTKDNS